MPGEVVAGAPVPRPRAAAVAEVDVVGRRSRPALHDVDLAVLRARVCPVSHRPGQLATSRWRRPAGWPALDVDRLARGRGDLEPVCPGWPSSGLELTMPPVGMPPLGRRSGHGQPVGADRDVGRRHGGAGSATSVLPYQLGDHRVVFNDPVLNSSSRTRLVGAPRLAGASGDAGMLAAVDVVPGAWPMPARRASASERHRSR